MKKELMRTERYIHIFDEAGKQLAHLPLNDSPILEGVPLLPPIEDDYIDDLAKGEVGWYDKNDNRDVDNFIKGYNKAREKYKFTEDDAKYFFECGRNFQINADITFTVAREHLSQPKMPTYFEFEMESMTIDEIREQGKGFLHAPTFKIKTTTNSQGQQVACGKYIY